MAELHLQSLDLGILVSQASLAPQTTFAGCLQLLLELFIFVLRASQMDA